MLTVSAFSRDRLATSLGVPASRFAVVPNGADHFGHTVADESVLDRHDLRHVPFLLAVGSDNATKNVAALLVAFARLSPGSVKLVIAGDGNRRVFAATNVADPPGVVRTGPLDDKSLVALYRRALALVFPSVYEGFGLPPLEAMTQGCQ